MIARAERPGLYLPRRRAALARAAIGLAALLIAGGCALLSAPPKAPALDVTGFWEGRSVASCAARMARCGGMVQISLSMIQNESSISGMYRCASGFSMCRGMDTNGRIAAGEIRGPGVALRVMFEDVSSCIFTGTFTDEAGGGSYICLQGGIVERGFWQVRRAFGPSPPPLRSTG